MAVEASASADRQIVEVVWDTSVVSGDAVQLHCVNPANGDVSVSGISQNDGRGYVTYPPGYSGTSEITVKDGSGNTDTGTIAVGDGSASTVPPDEAPPDTEEPPEEKPPIDWDLHPFHPIVLPPDLGFNPPPSEFPPHPEPN